MTREEAIKILKSMSDISTQGEAIDMAIEALQREEAEAKGYCHRIKPKEYFKNDAMQKLREMPRYLNGIKEKQITKVSADAETNEAIKLAMITLVDTLDDTVPAKPKTKAAPKKEPKRKKFDTGKLRALLNGGWSVPKIADEMGVDASTIYYHMKKEGLTSDRT